MNLAPGATLRANPGYDLVSFDCLAQRERDLLDGETDAYGLLRPRDGANLPLRAADADTALLFLTLRDPAPLPCYVRSRWGRETDRAVERLIVDGVLQIEQDGEFVSGPRGVVGRASDGGHGRIGALSCDALRYGQELAAAGLAAEPITARLYSYGTRPVTAALAARLGNAGAIAAHVGTGADGPAQASLRAAWAQAQPEAGEDDYWRSWRPRRARHGLHAAGWKLYVSPHVDAIGLALAAVAGSLATSRGVIAIKIAAHVGGFCRPDKLVVYFERLDDLHEGAARLRPELRGCPAHGVPFTAAVTSDGLLSFGLDPPVVDDKPTSWRHWVSQRLAEYLVLGGSSGLEPAKFALARLRLDGIDTDTWIPPTGMWEEALASA